MASIIRGDQPEKLKPMPGGKFPAPGRPAPPKPAPAPGSDARIVRGNVGNMGKLQQAFKSGPSGSTGGADKNLAEGPSGSATVGAPGKGAKPRQEGETDAAYAKRLGNFAASQKRLQEVGITGGVNKATPEQLKAFQTKYGHMPSGYKGNASPTPQPTENIRVTKPGPNAKPGEHRRFGLVRGAREALGGHGA